MRKRATHGRKVVPLKRGREKFHYLNPAPIAEILHRWIDKYERRSVQVLSDLPEEGA